MTAVASEQRAQPADLGTEAGTRAHDLAFVGAGVSTAYVLMSLLGTLSERPPASPLQVVVVERASDPFPGVAYGSRAARGSLLITSLRDFLPDDERALFTAWLSVNKGWVFDEFRAQAGPRSVAWWARHEAEIARDDFDPLYLPRYVFGLHIAQRTQDALDRARETGVAVTRVVQDEVLSIDAADGGYLLRCGDQDVRARRVVLAAGSLPVASRLDADAAPTAALVDDPFDGMGAALDRIRTSLEQQDRAGDRPPHVVLIGANAGTMDMLYQLNDLDLPAIEDTVFTVLSPRGVLPERMEDGTTPHPFTAESLVALQAASTVAAEDVFAAALADIARGRETGLGVSDTLRPVAQAVVALLPRLSTDQALEFAGWWGTELGRHQRRAGGEYCDVLDHLATGQRLRLVAGSFAGVQGTGETGVRVRYERDGVVRDLPVADAVVNCAGPARRIQDAGAALLSQLIGSGLCRTTPFGGGIAVDPDLTAAPGLHVMGPLLAGNLVNGGPLWHMEHCGRISAYGTALGADLARSLLPV